MATSRSLPRCIPALCITALCVGAIPQTASAQVPEKGVPPTAAFREARALYYTPEDKGLQGFQCDASFDWKSFIEKATHAPADDNSPQLAYLRTVRLTVNDDLNGSGQLRWAQPPNGPSAADDSVARVRDGLEQMWSGFFQTWNGLYTANIISQTDATTTVERTSDGYRVFSREGDKVAEESFGGDFTLHALHVSTPAMDTRLTPAFENTPAGRLITSWSSVTRQPPTAPGTSVQTTVHYTPVNGFQIPSEVIISVATVADFDFHLSGCTVSTKSGQSTPASPR